MGYQPPPPPSQPPPPQGPPPPPQGPQQQPPHQQPPHGQPWPPQQPQWQPMPPRRPRNNRPLIIALAIGIPVLVLTGFGVLGAITNDSGSPTGSPADVAERFVDAVNAGDTSAAEAELCEAATLLPMDLDEAITVAPELTLTEELVEPVGGFGTVGSGLEDSSGTHVGNLFVKRAVETDPYCVGGFTVGPAQ